VTRARRSAWLAAYAVVTFLAFPQPVGDGVLDLGWLLGWLAPALLILGLRGLAPRAAAGWGFAGSLLAHSLVLHWIFVVTVVYGHAPAVVGVLAPVLLASYIAAFGALFGAGHAALAGRGLASPFATAALWTALDHLRSFALTGFPWATLGYAQHESPWLLPLASFGGVYALSFVSALGGAALAACADPEARRGRAVRAAFGVVALAHLAGALAPDPEADAGRETVRVAVLQGNIDQGVKWSRAAAERTLRTYEAQTRAAAEAGARVVVWPETAVPGAVDGDPDLRAWLAQLARTTGALLVVGGVGLDFDDAARPRHYYDSAYAIDPVAGFTDRYDKTHLVPFGEYVPFRGLIGLFVGAVASGIASADVTPGERPRSVVLDPGGERELRVGVVICYELLFPNLVRRFAADGAELLLGITNDAWYGRTGAPHQFLAITALRSAETGLWTARAANTGVSGFIDGAGRVRERTPVFEQAWRVADVPRARDPRRGTFYVRYGDVFAGACWAGLAVLAIRARRRPLRDACAKAGDE
jgi:apolipoprotein N-acyltransferase